MSSKDTSSIDNSSSFSSVGSDGNETASQLLNKDNEKVIVKIIVILNKCKELLNNYNS